MSGASAALLRLIDQLWGQPAADSPVRVVTGGSLPAGFRPVESYAVLPNPSRARFLVPLGDRRAAGASVARYNGMRTGGVRSARTALGVSLRLPGTDRLLRHRLVVGVDQRLPDRELAEHLLLEHLRADLGRPRLFAGIGVRPVDPNSKPSLLLLAPGGHPVGHTKVGWNEPTRRMVQNEARAIAAVQSAGLRELHLPRLIAAGSWRERVYRVIEPLPPERAVRQPVDQPPPLSITAEMVQSLGMSRAPLSDSAYWLDVRSRVERLCRDGEQPELASAVSRYAESIGERFGGTELAFGFAHGDWAPWNMAWFSGRFFAWDWEHSADNLPVGYDQVHYGFQCAFSRRADPLAQAVGTAVRSGAPILQAMGLRRDAREAVLHLHLLEVCLGQYDLWRSGAGWKANFYPGSIQVLAERRAALQRAPTGC